MSISNRGFIRTYNNEHENITLIDDEFDVPEPTFEMWLEKQDKLAKKTKENEDIICER